MFAFKVNKIINLTKKVDLKRPYDVMNIANYILQHFADQNKTINDHLLQKILYFLQADYLRHDPEKPLFLDQIHKWGIGPVIPAVYNNFKSENGNPYGQIAEPRPYYIIDDNYNWYYHHPELYTIDKSDQKRINPLADEIYQEYHNDAYALIKVTQQEPMIKEHRQEIARANGELTYTNDEIAQYYAKPDNWFWSH